MNIFYIIRFRETQKAGIQHHHGCGDKGLKTFYKYIKNP